MGVEKEENLEEEDKGQKGLACLEITFYCEDFQLKDGYSYQMVMYFLQNIKGTPTLICVGIAKTYVWKIGSRRQRIRRIGPRNRQRRRQQAGAGLDLSTAIDLGRKAAGSKLGKMMINDAIDYIPIFIT